MLEGSCDCGAVRVTVDAPLTEVTDCNCGICRRTGALWAYFSPRRVAVTGPTEGYRRGERTLTFNRCRGCGCVVSWTPVDPAQDRMGINTRLLEPRMLKGVPTRLCDGASW